MRDEPNLPPNDAKVLLMPGATTGRERGMVSTGNGLGRRRAIWLSWTSLVDVGTARGKRFVLTGVLPAALGCAAIALYERGLPTPALVLLASLVAFLIGASAKLGD